MEAVKEKPTGEDKGIVDMAGNNVVETLVAMVGKEA